MTWASVKIIFKKSYAWCVQHWRWLIFGLVALVAYVTGRRNAKNLWMQAELARKQYKKEAEKIELIHANKSKEIKKAEKDFEEKIEKIEKTKSKDQKNLEDTKKSDILTLSKNETEIDKSLKDMGIEEI